LDQLTQRKQAGQACTGEFYRTMQDPVCPAQGYTYDAGCARCIAQKDCPPKRLATGPTCVGNSVTDTRNCTTCPNQCVQGTSFVSNDCAIDGQAYCSACRSTCGDNRYISTPCSIEEVCHAPVLDSNKHIHTNTHFRSLTSCMHTTHRTQNAQTAKGSAQVARTWTPCAQGQSVWTAQSASTAPA
jgi:hypothetical protein